MFLVPTETGANIVWRS